METKDTNIETPLAAEIPEGEMGHSLLALVRAHAEQANSDQAHVDQANAAQAHAAQAHSETAVAGPAASAMAEATVIERPAIRSGAKSNSLQMAEMYLAIGQLLELLHNRIVDNPPPSGSAEEMNEMIQASEERQCNTIEAALKQWESERKAQEAERMIRIESLQVQAQIEVNRLLRVMWLGTGLAAAGAGMALFLMRT
jgi:hypothetical protein